MYIMFLIFSFIVGATSILPDDIFLNRNPVVNTHNQL